MKRLPFLAALVAWSLAGCAPQPVHEPTAALPGPSAGLPIRPDPKLTPGDTLNVTVQDICRPGYAKSVRNVTQQEKDAVYAEYHIAAHKPGDFEVDHLISLELGGSNDIRNLWIQSYTTHPWNAHVKDTLENELHAEVCSGKVDLATAQHEIATDWIACYQKRMPASAQPHP